MLKRSMIVSAALHAGIIAAASFAWPYALAPSDEDTPVIPVDLVEIADVTNVAPTVQEKPPEAAPPPEAEAPPQPQEAAPPPQEAEVAPPTPDEKPAPPPQKQAEIKDQAPAPANPVLPRRKPKPDAQAQKFDVDSVLAMLDKRAPKPQAPPANARVAETTTKGIGDQSAMAMDLRDALRTKMYSCWNPPVGAPNAEKLIVQVRVFLAPDGTLAQPPQLEPGTRTAAASNPFMRTAAEAALRAVNVCEPYKDLPPERYETWREVVMTFDPSKMIR